MKKMITIFVTMLMLAGSYETKSQINAGISFNTFYNELSPYGRWVNNPQYGQVWISNEMGFEPYSSNGRWEYTNLGWMWASDYAWGWAPFHYGRWAYLNHYGWAWVPGYEWAPAWVGWCNYGGYYGWAPLSPGLGFNYSFGSIPYNNWRFVRHQYINDRNIYRHYQRPAINANQYNNVTVINNTVVNNNVTYVAGPAREQFETITRKKLEPKNIAFTDQAVKKTEVVNKKEIRVYRPASETTAPVKNATTIKQPVRVNGAETEQQPAAVQPLKEPVKQQQLIKKQQTPVPDDATIVKEQQQSQRLEKQQARDRQPDQSVQKETINRQQQNNAPQQQMIRKQQQDQTVQQEAVRKQQQNEARQQEVLRRQQDQSVQQEAVRRQQQNEARQQEAIRRQQQQANRQQEQQIRQQRQAEVKQQRVQQAPAKQQQWTSPSAPQRQAQPVRQSLPPKKGKTVL